MTVMDESNNIEPGDWQSAEHNRGRRQHKLALQRRRRNKHPRIDYYPSAEAMAAIRSRMRGGVGGDQSSVINRLVLAAAKQRDGHAEWWA